MDTIIRQQTVLFGVYDEFMASVLGLVISSESSIAFYSARASRPPLPWLQSAPDLKTPDISQGNKATRLRCDEISNDTFTENLLLSVAAECGVA